MNENVYEAPETEFSIRSYLNFITRALVWGAVSYRIAKLVALSVFGPRNIAI